MPKSGYNFTSVCKVVGNEIVDKKTGEVVARLFAGPALRENGAVGYDLSFHPNRDNLLLEIWDKNLVGVFYDSPPENSNADFKISVEEAIKEIAEKIIKKSPKERISIVYSGIPDKDITFDMMDDLKSKENIISFLALKDKSDLIEILEKLGIQSRNYKYASHAPKTKGKQTIMEKYDAFCFGEDGFIYCYALKYE